MSNKEQLLEFIEGTRENTEISYHTLDVKVVDTKMGGSFFEGKFEFFYEITFYDPDIKNNLVWIFCVSREAIGRIQIIPQEEHKLIFTNYTGFPHQLEFLVAKSLLE